MYLFIFLGMDVLSAYMSVNYCSAWWIVRISDPLELQLQVVVSLHVGAGYQTSPLKEHLVTEPSLQPSPPMELLIKASNF